MYKIKDKISDYRAQKDEKEENKWEEKEAKGRKARREGNEGEKHCKMLIVYKEVGKSLKSKCLTRTYKKKSYYMNFRYKIGVICLYNLCNKF